MVNEVFALDETVALAKQKACEMLGAEEKYVDFEVIQQPSKKVFGMFGGKLAQVKATLKKSPSLKALEYLKEVLFYMGFENLSVKITAEEPDFCEIKIDSDNPDDIKLIIGKYGSTLEALQYLTSFVANEKNERDEFYKIRLEAGNYREKRKEILTDLAKRIAEKASVTHRIINLEPMKSYERKIIHTAVGEIEGVKSWSTGEGERRHIVIAPDEGKN